ncbi:MAG: hypothetical protein RH917_08540 [Lacipirellulaceae bacterium]
MLPEREWQKQALKTIGNRENALKWVAVLVLDDLSIKAVESEEDWYRWWTENSSVFEIERNTRQAADTAKAAIERCEESVYMRVEHEIASDIPELNIEDHAE